jgi:hypothetical protein
MGPDLSDLCVAPELPSVYSLYQFHPRDRSGVWGKGLLGGSGAMDEVR